MSTLIAASLWFAIAAPPESGQPASQPFVIQIVDDESGRGVPLVELKTVDNVRYVTDNGGLVVTGPQSGRRVAPTRSVGARARSVGARAGVTSASPGRRRR